jgi:hypothetical protein
MVCSSQETKLSCKFASIKLKPFPPVIPAKAGIQSDGPRIECGVTKEQGAA